MLYIAWKRGLPRKCSYFVLFRPIKKRSFDLLCVLDQCDGYGKFQMICKCMSFAVSLFCIYVHVCMYAVHGMYGFSIHIQNMDTTVWCDCFAICLKLCFRQSDCSFPVTLYNKPFKQHFMWPFLFCWWHMLCLDTHLFFPAWCDCGVTCLAQVGVWLTWEIGVHVMICQAGWPLASWHSVPMWQKL